MSLKYQRVKQHDLDLPAPLRWLTRAFSSITLAVILLVFVVLYGIVASVPLGLLAIFGLYLLAVLTTAVPAAVVGHYVARGRLLTSPQSSTAVHFGTGLGILAAGLIAAGALCWWVATWLPGTDWYHLYRAQVIYRLPWLEMTELEFYAWFPMRLVLLLFVINMVWATIRRIEFSFVNIGVLTVHTGIVLIAVGSIIYGRVKLEGDMILWRDDLGGRPVSHFYDATEPAVYLFGPEGMLMIPLPELPRYNDYDPGTGRLQINLHEREGFAEMFGPDLKAVIPGFYAYGQLANLWVDGDEDPRAAHLNVTEPNPALGVTFGDEHGPADGAVNQLLIGSVPNRRVLEMGPLAIELLDNPSPQRVEDLHATFEGAHGLVVEVPGEDFREVFAIAPGQQITVGDTGYTLTINEVGPYGMPFISPGYEGASDTVARVTINDGSKTWRRIAMHRYPERSQDFVPAPDDPNVGPMGRRQDPDPAIRMAYLDTSRVQYHLIAEQGDVERLRVLVRLPPQPGLNDGKSQAFSGLLGDRSDVVLPRMGGGNPKLLITKAYSHAAQIEVPVQTPKGERQPKDEGTYIHSLLPVDLSLQNGKQDEPWQTRLWMAHMRYPDLPEGPYRPQMASVPGVGQVAVVFSRTRHPLPFSVHLDSFEMKPYPGSDIPADFQSQLTIADLQQQDENGNNLQVTGVTRLNNPFHYSGFKLSQTGWDPGDARDPQREARNAAGQFTRQQRFSIIGVGNNVGIRVIFVGSALVVIGIPWAFYVKPWLVGRKRDRLKRQLAEQGHPALDKTRARGKVQPEPADEREPAGTT